MASISNRKAPPPGKVTKAPPPGKVTVEYEDPRTGKVRKRRMRGDVDKISARWNDVRDGRLVAISLGWQ